MATSGYKDIALTSWDTLRFSWSRSSYSIAGNSSTIYWELQLISTAYGAIYSNPLRAWSVIVDGNPYSGSVSVAIGNNQTKLLASGSTVIYHNADGSKEFSYSFSQVFNITFSDNWIGTISGSSTGTLETLPRQATLLSAPHFTDEENPTITYSNPAGNAVTSLQACIASVDGQTVYVPYRDISKTGTEYTFYLTEAEREALRWATINSNTLTVKFYVTTVIGNAYYYSTLDKILTIANAAPTLSAAVVADQATRDLTGNDNTLIKYRSNVVAAATYSALKHSNIKSYAVSCGAKAASANPATFEAVESGLFTFAVTDSRGNTNTVPVTKNLIEYIKLSCNLFANNPTTEGVLDFVISGDYFNGSFGAVANALTVEYRYKQTSGDYGDWVAATPVLNGNKYEAKLTLTGLDYRKAYTLQARAKDEATAYIESVERTVKTIPVYDWGEDDFNFNVPVSINNVPMTDFIVEQGEADGWFYRKWNSGFAECWKVHYENGVNAAESNYNGFYYSGTISVPFPFTFANLPTVTVDGGSTANMNFVRTFGKYADAASFIVVGNTSVTNTNITVDIRAIGKWK